MDVKQLKHLLVEADSAFAGGAYPSAISLIEEAMELEPDLANNLAVKLGHAYLLSAPWEETNEHLPKNINFFENSGWLQSVRQNEPINSSGEPIPWWTYGAIEFIEMRIESTMSVFEWGSGNSTCWWASRVNEVKAVEHDLGWFREMRKRLPASVKLVAQLDMSDYIKMVQTDGDLLWEIVVIDGEERNKCAELASRYTKQSGIIIFDNTDNATHREGVLTLMNDGWKRLGFFGLIPSYCYKSCTSIFYRDERWVTCRTLPCDSQAVL